MICFVSQLIRIHEECGKLARNKMHFGNQYLKKNKDWLINVPAMRCLHISAFIVLSEKIISGFLTNFKAIRNGCIGRWGDREELRTWLSNVRKLGFQLFHRVTNVRVAKPLYYKSMGFSVFLRTMFVAAYPENQPSVFRQLKVDGTETYDQLCDMEEKIATLDRKVAELQRTVSKHIPEGVVGASDSKPKATDLPSKKSPRPSHVGNGSEVPSKTSATLKKPPPKGGPKPTPAEEMPSNVSVSGKRKVRNGRATPPKAEPTARKPFRKVGRKSRPVDEVSTKAPAARKRKATSVAGRANIIHRKDASLVYLGTPKRTRGRIDDHYSELDVLDEQVEKKDDAPTKSSNESSSQKSNSESASQTTEQTASKGEVAVKKEKSAATTNSHQEPTEDEPHGNNEDKPTCSESSKPSKGSLSSSEESNKEK